LLIVKKISLGSVVGTSGTENNFVLACPRLCRQVLLRRGEKEYVMEKVVFEFENVNYEVSIETFVKKSGAVIQLPSGRLVKVVDWRIYHLNFLLEVQEMEVIKAEVIK
jgi:hypothetical protein